MSLIDKVPTEIIYLTNLTLIRQWKKKEIDEIEFLASFGCRQKKKQFLNSARAQKFNRYIITDYFLKLKDLPTLAEDECTNFNKYIILMKKI